MAKANTFFWTPIPLSKRDTVLLAFKKTHFKAIYKRSVSCKNVTFTFTLYRSYSWAQLQQWEAGFEPVLTCNLGLQIFAKHVNLTIFFFTYSSFRQILWSRDVSCLVSSRLVTCRLDLVSSHDFRLVTGSTFHEDLATFFLVIPGARLSRTPSLLGPLTHLCDLEAGYRGDGLQSWWGGTGI